MNHPAHIALPQPIAPRWVREVAGSVAGAWRRHRANRRLERRIEAMADLDPAVLLDIGAPDDLLNQAAARRQTETRRLEELRILAHYRGVDSRFW